MKMESCLFILSLSALLLVSTADRSVRLQDGEGPCAGRVEVLQEGQWGTVCGGDWDMDDAAVVCRQLLCGDAVEASGGAKFGPGKGNIWMSWVNCGGTESTLSECRNSGRGEYNYCGHGNDASVICSGLAVHLTGGPHLCAGRLEFQHRGSWYTVCDADFDLQDAAVVCRQLGCGVPVEVLGAAVFGKGGGQVWTNKIDCRNKEDNFRQCLASTLDTKCSHDTDVGVKCFWYTDARLAGGSDSCSGRVELQYFTEWGTVCDAFWDMRAASVLCQQLGCGGAVAALLKAWFGEGSGRIWADVFDCQGKETHLSQCAVSTWSRAACSHGHDAGVICNGSSLSTLDGTVRLFGERGCEGLVQVYYQHTWSRVLLDSWSYREASVVCRQLGCGFAVRIYNTSQSETGDSDVCLTGYQCSGSESDLGNCSAPHTLSCDSRPHVSIACSKHRTLRLVGDGGGCAGRLEVFHQGSWGTVCDDSWDLKDAQVVCRQLQCGTALLSTSFGPGNGSIWLDQMGCMGNELSLWDCPSAQWGQHDCFHKEDVGVVCSEHSEMRLAKGCSGQLEVYYNGTWGNVCFNQMNRKTLNVICQQLNCGKSGTVSNTGSRLKGAPNWLDFVQCRLHDSTLWQCPSSPWGVNKCDADQEVANITCESGEKTDVPRSRVQCSADNLKLCSSHLPLRLQGGNKECSGRVELWYGGSWGTICDDLWDISDAQVVCRQVGCGAALEAHGNAAFGRGNGSIWLNEVNCRGDELHLWDCPHSLQDHRTSCSHKEDAGVTCAVLSSEHTSTTGIPETPTTTTTVKPGPPSSPSSPGQAIPTVVFLVLGALLFLLLVLLALLAAQLYQNRVLKRALYQGGLTPLHDAVYEEIEYNLTRGEKYGGFRKGSVRSEELPSGYEDVEHSEGDPLSGEEEKPEYYDDISPVEKSADGLSEELRTEDTAEDYDDAVTAVQTAGPGLMGTEDTAEDYDDAVGAEPSPHESPGERVLTPLPPATDPTDYDDVGGGGSSAVQESPCD